MHWNYCSLVLNHWYITNHDDVIKWKHFLRYWPFVRGIHRSPVNSPHKGQWRGALMFSLIWIWINGWVNTREADDLRRYRAHYDVSVMYKTQQDKHSLGRGWSSLGFETKTGKRLKLYLSLGNTNLRIFLTSWILMTLVVQSNQETAKKNNKHN